MDLRLQETAGVRLAVEGCGHGTLHAIYASVEEACKQKGWPGVDLLIIGGDFQSVRNAYDLNCVNMPAKYRSMCDFHEYYSGLRLAPCLTIFVGGNHEASNYLFELYFGGWVAPNIYYMGAANLLQLGPLRIAGMSGIWKGFDYRKSHLERLPYNESDMRSIYHVRELDVRKLLQVQDQVDIAVSHDWPQGVVWKGNWKQLFRFKPFFEDDANSGKLGSIAANEVLNRLRPRYWFSAHLHCKYAAIVRHEERGVAATGSKAGPAVPSNNDDEMDMGGGGVSEGSAVPQPINNNDEIDLELDDDDDEVPTTGKDGSRGSPALPVNDNEIDLDLDEDDIAPTGNTSQASASKEATGEGLAEARAALPKSFQKPAQPPPEVLPSGITNLETNFLALDKCLPKRHFLQLLPVPNTTDSMPERPFQLTYDREWLAITRAFALTEPPVMGDPDHRHPPAKSRAEYQSLIAEQRTWVDNHITDAQRVIPANFVVTAPIYDGGDFRDPTYQQVAEHPNPQTATFCQLLQIPNPLEISDDELRSRLGAGPRPDTDRGAGFGRGRGRGGFGGGGGGGRGGRGGQGGGGRGHGRGRGR
jgi:lariat debranching enzyme